MFYCRGQSKEVIEVKPVTGGLSYDEQVINFSVWLTSTPEGERWADFLSTNLHTCMHDGSITINDETVKLEEGKHFTRHFYRDTVYGDSVRVFPLGDTPLGLGVPLYWKDEFLFDLGKELVIKRT